MKLNHSLKLKTNQLLILLGLFLYLVSTGVFAQTKLENLDYDLNHQGVSQLKLFFDNSAPAPKVSKTATGLNLTFSATDIDYDLVNLYDTSDIGGLVDSLEVAPTNTEEVKVNLFIKQDFSYLIVPDNNNLVIEIAANKKLAANKAQTTKSNYFTYSGDLVSLSYHHVPIRELLAELAAFLNLNLIISDSVTGDVTLELKDIPSDQALDLLLISKGLATRQKDKVILVAPAEELAKLDEDLYKASQASEATRPLEELFLKVRYAKAKELKEFILNEASEESSFVPNSQELPSNLLPNFSPPKSSSSSNFLSKRGQLIVDERTNSIYARDIPENLEKIKRLVDYLDVPVEQVMIEARIVVAKNGVSDDLGVTWGLQTANHGGLGTIETGIDGIKRGAFENNNKIEGNRGASAGFDSDRGLNFGFVSNNIILDLELAALEAENRSEVISQPKVITSDRNKAIIRSGKEIPYSSTNTDGERTTDFRQAELRLEVTPQIVSDGKIFLDLQVNNDSKGEDTQDAGPTINTNAVETQILVNNSETLVIGGIFTSEFLEAEYKVPFLGDLPLLGWFFSRSFSSQEKVELLVFVTPRLVKTNQLLTNATND